MTRNIKLKQSMEKKAKKSLSSKFNSLFDENKRKFKKYNARTKKTNKKKNEKITKFKGKLF